MFVAAGINARGVPACGQTEKRTGYPVTSVSSSPCRPEEGIKVSPARDQRPSPGCYASVSPTCRDTHALLPHLDPRPAWKSSRSEGPPHVVCLELSRCALNHGPVCAASDDGSQVIGWQLAGQRSLVDGERGGGGGGGRNFR